MSDSARPLAQLAVGAIGFAVGGPLGFAVSTVLFNMVVPPRPMQQGGFQESKPDEKNTAINTPLFQVFGQVERKGGDVIRCAKDKNGKRSGIKIRIKKEGGGGGSGGGPKAPETKVEKQYLCASFALCEGFTYIDRIVEENQKDGQVVRWLRDVLDGDWRGKWKKNTSYSVDDTVKRDGKKYICVASHISSDNTKPGDDEADEWTEYWLVLGDDDDAIDFTTVYGAATGREVGIISEHVRIYYGSEEQPVDSAEQEWYDEGVSADRGVTKVVFNDYGPLQAGTTFSFLLRNSLTNKRTIIKTRLNRAGIPDSRIDLRSIPADAESFGWWVDRLEPARELAEKVAATAFHDLHFMPTSQGMVFTDISRGNPTVVRVEQEGMGAFSNSDGNGSIISSATFNYQSAELKPRELKVGFRNADQNYKDDAITIFWTNAQGEPQTIDLNMVGSVEENFEFGEIAMRELQASEGMSDIVLMPSFCRVAPGTVLNIPEPSGSEDGARKLMRVVSQKIGADGLMTNSCTAYDSAVYVRVYVPDSHYEPVAPPLTQTAFGTPELIWMDGAGLTEEIRERPAIMVAGRVPDGKVWGALQVEISDPRIETPILEAPATAGVLGDAYSYDSGDVGAFDYGTTLRVTMDDGSTLASCDESDVLNNYANVLWFSQGLAGIAPADGIWRGTYVAFTTATAIDPGIYDLTGLSPGIGGDEEISSIPAGARVVRLTDESGDPDLGVELVAIPPESVGVLHESSAINTVNTRKRVDDVPVAVQARNLSGASVPHILMVNGDDINDPQAVVA